MRSDAARDEAYEARIAELEGLVAAQVERNQAQHRLIERLEARVAELERQLSQNSGNSGKPPSRGPAAERQRQADARKRRKQSGAGGGRKGKGKQRGSKGSGLEMSANPDEVIDHRRQRCEGCGAELDDDATTGFCARQVIELPEVTPAVTEHRAHTCRCRCGHVSAGAFPEAVWAPISYGPRVRAVVAHLLGRQLPLC